MGTKRRKTSASIERSEGGEKHFYRFRAVGFYAFQDDGKMTQNRGLPVFCGEIQGVWRPWKRTGKTAGSPTGSR
jgi:hypothetical protein